MTIHEKFVLQKVFTKFSHLIDNVKNSTQVNITISILNCWSSKKLLKVICPTSERSLLTFSKEAME